MKNPVFYKHLQKNAKKWADYFSWKKATDQSLRLIEKVSI
jgi:hypothetical protein